MRDHLDTVRELVERWNSGRRGLGEIEELFDPAFALYSPLARLSGEPYRGHAGVVRWTEELDEQFAEWSICDDELREADDRVLLISRIRARGRASGVALEFPSAGLFAFAADGRVSHLRIYADIDEALRAAGLLADPDGAGADGRDQIRQPPGSDQ